jgi:NAD(P)-dependent dehydrogenase (short-subunit alcohol dehydrogenase family)
MLKQGYGSIVNVASKAAFDRAPGAAAYAASKAAAVAMMDSLAADLKGSSVRVNPILRVSLIRRIAVRAEWFYLHCANEMSCASPRRL